MSQDVCQSAVSTDKLHVYRSSLTCCFFVLQGGARGAETSMESHTINIYHETNALFFVLNVFAVRVFDVILEIMVIPVAEKGMLSMQICRSVKISLNVELVFEEGHLPILGNKGTYISHCFLKGKSDVRA